MVDPRLPVPVTVHGPLKSFSLRVHVLSQTGRAEEALAAADAYTAIARAVGDHKTVTYLYQGRMYAYEALGRYQEAIMAGEELLRRHRAAGNRLNEPRLQTLDHRHRERVARPPPVEPEVRRGRARCEGDDHRDERDEGEFFQTG